MFKKSLIFRIIKGNILIVLLVLIITQKYSFAININKFIQAPIFTGMRTGFFIYDGISLTADFEFPFTIPIYDELMRMYIISSFQWIGIGDIARSVYSQDLKYLDIMKFKQVNLDIDSDGKIDISFEKTHFFMPIGFMFGVKYEILWGIKMLINTPKFFNKLFLYLCGDFGFTASFIPFFIRYLDDNAQEKTAFGLNNSVRDALIDAGIEKKAIYSGFRWAVYLQLKIELHKRLYLTIDAGYPNLMVGLQAGI